jgi:hypothetical protein
MWSEQTLSSQDEQLALRDTKKKVSGVSVEHFNRNE